jgi:glucan biosynthesis protein C
VIDLSLNSAEIDFNIKKFQEVKMNSVTKVTTNRLTGLDRMRTILVIMVIIFHNALCFTGKSWYVINPQPISLMPMIILYLDVFMMTGLFLIAGFFTFPVYKSKGKKKFLKSKTQRLGIPLVLASILLNPIVGYIAYLHKNNLIMQSLMDYPKFFIKYLSSIFSLQFGYSNNSLSVKNGLFHTQHLWFLFVLLTFFIVYGVIKTDTTELNKKKLTKSKFYPRLTIFSFFFVTTVLFIAGNLLLPHDQLFHKTPWISITPLLAFQSVRVILYLAYFISGIYLYKNKELQNYIINKTAIPYILIMLLGMFLLLVAMGSYYDKHNYSIQTVIIYSFGHSMFCIAILIILFKLFIKIKKPHSKLWSFLSEHSYNTYIVHMAIVISVQYLLLSIKFSGMLAFILGSGLSVILSYLLSRLIGAKRFKY